MDDRALRVHSERVVASFRELAARTRAREPRFLASVGSTPCTSAYPLSVYLSFWSGDPQADETLVLSLQVWHGEDGYVCGCDVLVDNRDVVAEAPSCVLSEPPSVRVREWLDVVVSEMIAWALAQEDAMVAMLHQAGDALFGADARGAGGEG